MENYLHLSEIATYVHIYLISSKMHRYTLISSMYFNIHISNKEVLWLQRKVLIGAAWQSGQQRVDFIAEILIKKCLKYFEECFSSHLFISFVFFRVGQGVVAKVQGNMSLLLSFMMGLESLEHVKSLDGNTPLKDSTLGVILKINEQCPREYEMFFIFF